MRGVPTTLSATGLPILLAMALAMVTCTACTPPPTPPGPGVDDDGAPQGRGPHGGALLRDDAGSGVGTLDLEVAVFEHGVEPRLRLWLTREGRPVPPREATATASLQRLGEPARALSFLDRGDFLESEGVIEEPHSFRLTIEVSAGTIRRRAVWVQMEARVTIPADTAAAGGVEHAVAAPRDLGRSLSLNGRVGIRPERLALLKPRFEGRVLEAAGMVGDRVTGDQVLATVESSATLARVPLVSPFAGILLDRRAVVGTIASTAEALYAVADLSEVLVDLDVYGTDAPHVRPGDKVLVEDDARGSSAESTVAYVSPLRDPHTQTTLVRVYLPNPEGKWSPGAFVTARIRLQEPPAAITVPPSAVQPWRGRDAVFIHADGVWEARPVRIGRRGEHWIEVLAGLRDGVEVAVGNTFLLRAELEKAGAGHDH